MKKLNFGCGNKILNGFDNVDIQKGIGITKNFDFEKFPYPLKDDTYDYILAEMILEHLDDPLKTLYELHRICKQNAIIRITVPYFNNIAMTNDLGHKHYFSHKTFECLISQPTIVEKQEKFQITHLKLTPTKPGKLLPKKLREILSMFMGALIAKVECELRVLK